MTERLPFGLYMKKCMRASENEPNALKLVEEHTTIAAPRLVDTWEFNGARYFIMTRVPGTPVLWVYHLMSYPERERFAKDLRNCVDQLRNIPNNTSYLICDSLGGPITDHRIPRGIGGPFNTEAEFNEYLTSHLDASFSEVVKIKNLSVREHDRFYFTHADFHPSNILVDRGRLSGIVDWESAGFWPEYWEFTKTLYCTHANSDIAWRTFGREYEPELEVEKELWYLTPFGS